MLDLAIYMTKPRAWHVIRDHYTKYFRYVQLKIETDNYLTRRVPSLTES